MESGGSGDVIQRDGYLSIPLISEASGCTEDMVCMHPCIHSMYHRPVYRGSSDRECYGDHPSHDGPQHPSHTPHNRGLGSYPHPRNVLILVIFGVIQTPNPEV